MLELVPSALAKKISETLTIPTIGIGAGPHCDGQVLVTPDMLGLTGFRPRFVKQFADLRAAAIAGARAYIDEVRTGEFPNASQSH